MAQQTIEQLLEMTRDKQNEYLETLPEQEAKELARKIFKAESNLHVQKLADNLNSNAKPSNQEESPQVSESLLKANSLSQLLTLAHQEGLKLVEVQMPPTSQDKKPNVDMMKLRLAIETAYYHQKLLDAAWEVDYTDLRDILTAEMEVSEAIDSLKKITDTIVNKELTNQGYYVTLCVETEIATKAVEWDYNAKFKNLASAEKYRDSLLSLLYKMNTEPPAGKDPEYIEGKRRIVITKSSAPNVVYDEYHF